LQQPDIRTFCCGRSISSESIAKMSFPTFKDLDKEASGKDQNRCVVQEILWAKILSAAANILFAQLNMFFTLQPASMLCIDATAPHCC